MKLTKAEIATRDSIAKRLRDYASKLEDAINVFNSEMAALKSKSGLEIAIENYNSAINEARGFAEDIINKIDEAISEKSERWQDSEKGQAAEEYKNAWESLYLEEVEVETPDDIDIPDMNHADELESAPESPE